jgi:uncharacterized protein (DUF4415 family)
MSEEDIRRYTVEQLRKMREQGLSQTDWARAESMTEEELERSIADDPDWKDIPEDWYKDAILCAPPGKKLVAIDEDVREWFREQGPDDQTRMNAVLRRFMLAHRKAPKKPERRRA